MTEELSWKKRTSARSEFVDNLERLVKSVVMIEINQINSKIESLCAMGVIKDDVQVRELREKIKQLQTGMQHGK
jgi:hypothetical protein